MSSLNDPAHLINLRGQITLSSEGEKRLHQGHPWLFSKHLESSRIFGGVLEVKNRKGTTCGYGLGSPNSKILVRMLCYGQTPPSSNSIGALIKRAWESRKRIFPTRSAYRVIHGEADGLPGLFIDRYADAWVLQTTCEGANLLEPLIIKIITQIAQPRIIIRRNDAKTRRHEGLPRFVDVPFGNKAAGQNVRYTEGEVLVEVDLLTDQKTGSFLDQSDNHILTSRYAFGRGLDVCTYHGGFALQLAQRCTEVTALDISAKALQQAKIAEALSPTQTTIDWLQADAFEYLPARAAAGDQYDTIVVDPPALASGNDSIKPALRAYSKLNQSAFTMLKPGAVLISCSCSGKIRPEAFDQMLLKSAKRTGRSFQVLEKRGAGADHPVLPNVPETEYLKCRFLRVLP